jgi:hypothetical protein
MARLKTKTRLNDSVKQSLLNSERFMGALAEDVGVMGYTIKRQIIADSPILCQPHYLDVIKNILKYNTTDELIVSETIHPTTYLQDN